MNFWKLSILLSLNLTGCVWNIDKPPPAGWTYYSGNGATKKEIEIAYLECGFPVPGDFSDYDRALLVRLGFDSAEKRYAALAEQHYCMKNSGFPTGRSRDPCSPLIDTSTGRLFSPDYPVCRPGAVIPKRSVENRINSPFCKLYPKAQLCQVDPYELTKNKNLVPVERKVVPQSSTDYVPPQPDSVEVLRSRTQNQSNKDMNRLLNGVR